MSSMKLASVAIAIFLLAQTDMPLAQTRPSGTIGYSASERRAVDARLDRLGDEMRAIQDHFDLKAATVRSLGRAIGLSDSFSDAKLIEIIRVMATEARRLKESNKTLKTELTALKDPLLRDPALRAIAKAEAAIDDGRLEDAEAAYTEAAAMRWNENEQALSSWDAIIEAQAKTAELRQDFRRAKQLRLKASDHYLAMTTMTHRRAFEKADAAAQGRYEEGLLFGRAEAIDDAINLWELRILPMVPPAQYPDLWAWAQHNLGNALQLQGERTGGEAGIILLDRAIAAYETALTVRTRAAASADWASTQNNLGVALKVRGERTEGKAGRILLERAIAAYEAALTVRTREFIPAGWATTQNNLGNALQSHDARAGDGTGIIRLDRAITAYEGALTVRTRAAMPADWATTQNNLGAALQLQGARTHGEAGKALLKRAIAAYEKALTVRTRAAMPADWATTRMNLGLALETFATTATRSAAKRHLRMAEAAYIDVLGVATPEGMAYIHSLASTALVRVRKNLSKPGD